MTVTDIRAWPLSPRARPTERATSGWTTSFVADASTAPAPPRTRAPPPRREMPKASRIMGGAAWPSIEAVTSTRTGIAAHVAENTRPATAATTIGLVTTRRATAHGDGVRPAALTSASTKNMGVKNPSWNTIMGRTAEASPRT